MSVTLSSLCQTKQRTKVCNEAGRSPAAPWSAAINQAASTPLSRGGVLMLERSPCKWASPCCDKKGLGISNNRYTLAIKLNFIHLL